MKTWKAIKLVFNEPMLWNSGIVLDAKKKEEEENKNKFKKYTYLRL